jgi:sarcosine oxidase/L-pipecolate oxidase
VTLIEASSVIPNPHGSSVDTSRIIRADYAHAPYARLAVEALNLWRTDEWGGGGRYMQNGLLSVFREDGSSGHQYARKSFETLKAMEGSQVEFLSSREDVLRAAPAFGKAMEIDAGYINWGAGWADAEAGVRYAKERIEKEGKVTLLSGTVKQLIYDHNDQKSTEGCPRVTGVMLSDQSVLYADLTVLATGAWTPKLVDLEGTVRATGQILLYIQITPEEQECLSHQPTIFNWTNGFFIIPPRNNLLKIARHGHGYLNPTTIPTNGGNGARMQVSLPETGLPVPLKSQEACRAALRELLPDLAERPFTKTRICWYTDT